MKKSAGFTLVELLVLVIIISFIVTLSTPRFSDTYKSLKTKSEAKKLIDYLRFTRSKAVHKQKTLEIFLVDSHVLEIQEFENERFSRHRIDSSLSIDMEPEAVSFFPNGMMSTFIIIMKDDTGNTFEISGTQNNSRINFNHIIIDYN